MVDISIVIPAYNEQGYIEQCLDAVLGEVERLSQRLSCEVIVVNNASTDATACLASRKSGVRVVHEPLKGLTRAREKGLQAARGRIVAYVDADTRMPRGWIATIACAFSEDKEVVCVSGPYRYYDAAPLTAVLVRLYWRMLAFPTYKLFRYMVVGGNFAVKKAPLEAIGGFDTRIAFYGEDTNIARRLAAVGRVRFTLALPMDTSARRLQANGVFKTAWVYAINFLSESVLRRPVTIEYDDVR